MQIEHIDVEDRRIAVHAPETIGGRTKYTDEFIGYCFSIYVQDAGRNVRAVKDIVQERHGVEIPQSSVYNWAKRGNWQEQGRELYHLLRKDIVTDIMDSMLSSAKEATAVLDAMLKGRDRPDATKVKIAFGLIDRVGLMPHSVVAEQIRLHVQERPASDVSSLSDEELVEMESSYQPSASYLPNPDILDAQVVIANQRRTPRT